MTSSPSQLKEETATLEWSKADGLKLSAACILLFFASFFFYFPAEEILITKLTALSSGMAGCPLKMQGQRISFLPPGLKIPQASLPSVCLSPTFHNGDVVIEDFVFKFSGLNFAPLGPKLTLQASAFRTDWSVTIVPTVSEQFIEIRDQKIRLQPILAQLRAGIELQGDALTNAQFSLKASGLSKMNVSIKSNNFIIPSQSISGLKIPTLNIGHLLIKAKLTDKNIYHVEEFTLGTSTSPLRAKFKGTITPNPMGLLFSQIDLQGEFSFSAELKKQFPLIEMLVQKYTLLNGFYQVKVQGTLASPQFL